MHGFIGSMVYALIWWTTLFAVLPIGTKPNPDADEHTGWRGAPEKPHIWRKVILTTVISTVLWFGLDALILSDWISFRHGYFAMPGD